MPIADYADYQNQIAQKQGVDLQLSTSIAPTSKLMALWPTTLPVSGTPTTSVSLDSSSAVSLSPLPNTTSNKIAIASAMFTTAVGGGASATAIDLLNHSGGLSAIVTTQQTTNLPTAALTRYTSGEGVMIGLIIYTQIGTTATTVSVSYTNQAGISGRVSPVITFGGTGNREVGRLFLIPLAAGDTGARSVEGVTVTATTGTAGNFGVVLFKPLTSFALESASGSMPLDAVSSGGITGPLLPFDDTACLCLMVITTVIQGIRGVLTIVEV